MLRIVVEVDAPNADPQSIKEKLATDFERYGDVRIVEVREIAQEQMRID